MRHWMLLLLLFLAQTAKPNEWRMSVPVKYKFILADGRVMVLKDMDREAKARIDSVGLRSAELTFRNKEVLIFSYEAGNLKDLRMRGARVECPIPESTVRSIRGFEFSRTVLTWPGRWKNLADADRFCLNFNDAVNFVDPPRYPFMSICFQDGCTGAGSLEILPEEN